MKLKIKFSKILILFFIFALGLEATQSIAYTDHTTGGKDLHIEYFRYANGGLQNGYALKMEDDFPIYQILSSNNENNFYCLNATVGDTWQNANVGEDGKVTYNREYNLNNPGAGDDLTQISSIREIANSESDEEKKYLTKVLWILDNMYVRDTTKSDSDNLKRKQDFLAKAGIRSNYELDMYDILTNESYTGYRYVPVTGYNYNSFVSNHGQQGYMYLKGEGENRTQVDVILPDELLEAAQQAAIWYFTNYLANNNSNSNTYNVLDKSVSGNTINNWLKRSGNYSQNPNASTQTGDWDLLSDYKEDNQDVGKWYQEQATIVCHYLIDAANNYAESNDTAVGNPLKISPAKANIEKRTINNVEYQVVGPIKIEEQREAVYELSNKIIVNKQENTGAYISDKNGNKAQMQIGENFYVAIPANKISSNKVEIEFSGTYNSNSKILWVHTTKNEQPVVEVGPGTGDIKLKVQAEIEDLGEFDLALRKRITKLTNSKGVEKQILSEKGLNAKRGTTYVAEDIASNQTATYKHRKDPVVVEKGDIIEYSITVYNEGDKAGYASTIVDKLPQGLALKGYTKNNTVSGTYEKGNVKYEYTYNPSTNEITFTNKNKNDLAAYNGGKDLDNETIKIECEVVEDAGKTNTYLTNIAYISKEHNSVDNKDITNEEGADRDSKPSNHPTATQKTTGDTYTGYKGATNNQSVYNDTNNGYYYKGQEDDDDFEVVVIPKKIEGKYDVVLIKEDQNGEDLRSEAIFEVNGEEKKVTGRLTIAKDVEINKDNLSKADVYTIKETKAPDKYCEFDGTITITVTKKLADDGKTYILDDKTYTVTDSKGNDITDTKDTKVYLKDGNLYVEVIDYEKEFDLKLMKFISKVNDNKTDREITVDAKNLNKKVDGKKVTTANYNVSKKPIEVKIGDYVTYTFRIYNEGELDGFATEITEDIPEGLKFVTENDENLTDRDREAIEFNKGFSWNVASKDSSGNIKTISTNYRSKAKGKNNLIKAFDSDSMTEPDSKDISVMFKVVSKEVNKVIRNEAEISEDEDEDGNPIDDRDSDTEQWKKENSDDNYDNDKKYPKYKEDDEDYDNIILKKVDLALTKFIVAISDDMSFEDGEYLTKDKTSKDAGSEANPYTRQTAVDTTPLKEGTATDANYARVKAPITVPEESYVLYNIRVYNEGDVDVYAGEVTDYLPNYLDYVDSDFNDKFEWKVEKDGKTVRTSYLSHANGTDKMLKAFDRKNDDGKGSELDYQDLQILARVNSKAPEATKLINTAEITKYEDKDGNSLEKDIDSEPGNVPEKNVEKRVEDDDDWEVVKIKRKKVDLALSKFIAAISEDTKIEDGEYLTPNKKVGSEENPYIRATAVDTTPLKEGTATDAKYSMVKDPLVVPAQSYVLYDIRVYNEGETDVYAGEVTDHLPEYLDFVECEFNDSFGWNVEKDGKTIKTTYLGYNEKKNEKNLLKAFDKKTDDGKGSGLDYRDLQVLCKVNEKAPSNTNIVNVAEITKYENSEGEDLPDDIDSTPDNVEKEHEDDDDYEVVLIKTFDLSLLKWVSTVYVTEDGKTETIQTGNTGDDSKDIIPKVEINRKKINSTVVKFGYTIKITNEGDIEGYAKEITDIVPEGLKFYKEDNNGWEEPGEGIITTRLLENTLLKPGESAEVTVIFRWINGSNNLGLKTNIAEISEDYNEEGVPDRDSTPGNKVWGEDDIDDAKVLLSISTGLVENVMMYALVSFGILVVFAGGIILIKKFVL